MTNQSHTPIPTENCPQCKKGCLACFNAGMTHVNAELLEALTEARTIIWQSDAPYKEEVLPKIDAAIAKAKGQ